MELYLILIIALFSVIQSIFGMGLLVFGTPTLLLLGYPFGEVLSILLPPSLTISAIQFYQLDKPKKAYVRDLLICCLPVLVLALAWTFIYDQKVNLYMLIAAILTFTALSRFSTRISNRLQAFITRHSRWYLLIMGAVHGLSNMGGSLLSAYAVSKHNYKKEVLSCIVTGYLLFGLVQLSTLSALNVLEVSATTVISCGVAAVVYLSIGNRIFKSMNEHFYQHVFSVFMLVYAGLMIVS
ncbi:hypothetical protein BCT93_22755 [Vibrio lentus]|uniref:TSUP family transporter n=1 Tax=Vibrio lentus TaxID=136468 RepID=UPI000C8409A8|nr:TSUP family transporter [Vibrio lentus]PMK67065.1 hypothetical protein BCT93_22755 [Vibrio lentus]